MNNKDKILYIANIRLPTEKAHGIQIMKMCEAFAMAGSKVELVVPRRKNNIKTDPFEYYNVKRNFEIKYVWCIDLVFMGWIGFWIETLTYTEAIMLNSFKEDTKSIYFSRDPFPALMLAIIGRKAVWEGHRGEENLFVKLLIKFEAQMVMITNGLKDLYIKIGAREHNILVSPDAVDLGDFEIQETKEEARKKVGFGSGDKIVVYTGHLYGWKGADTLAKAAGMLESDIQVCFLGGTEIDVASFKERYDDMKNVRILGKKSHKEMPYYIRSADVLVIPNSGKDAISRLYTSPMKLFEYMASGRPIVASNLPSIREILDETNAYLFEADNEIDLSKVIKNVLNEQIVAEKKAVAALIKVRDYTWKKRAENIIKFII